MVKLAPGGSLFSQKVSGVAPFLITTSAFAYEHNRTHFLTANIYSVKSDLPIRKSMSKSVTRTIRLDRETDIAIAKYAEEEGTSVNFIANKALKAFIEWHAVTKKVGLCSVAAPLLSKLIECHDEEKCRELGSWAAKETIRPLAEYLFGQVTLESALEVLKKFGQYGSRFEIAESTDGHFHSLLLKHSLGKKWSVFYSGLMETLFKSILGKNVVINRSEEFCVVKIEF